MAGDGFKAHPRNPLQSDSAQLLPAQSRTDHPGAAPKETVVLSSIVRQSAPVFFNGRQVADQELMSTDSRHEIDFRTTGGNELITVAVHTPLFDAVARATLGAEFFDDKPADRFSLHNSRRRPDLNRSLVALLDEAFTHSEALERA